MPQCVLLDFRAQPLLLEVSVVERLGLIEDTLEKCLWAINSSVGDVE